MWIQLSKSLKVKIVFDMLQTLVNTAYFGINGCEHLLKTPYFGLTFVNKKILELKDIQFIEGMMKEPNGF